jgi:uncharacterized protein YjiS (DUF1127 family)
MFVSHAIAGPAPRGSAVATLLHRAKEGLRLWHRRRKAVAALEALSDRTLEDMGVARAEIEAVVEAHLRRAPRTAR